MSGETEPTDRSELRRGAILVAVGIWLLVSSLGLFDLDYANSWPLLLVLLGVAQVAFPRCGEACDGRGAGISLIAWGALTWIAVHRLWGFGWTNVWPLILVVVGIQIVWGALVRGGRRAERGTAGRGAP